MSLVYSAPQQQQQGRRRNKQRGSVPAGIRRVIVWRGLAGGLGLAHGEQTSSGRIYDASLDRLVTPEEFAAGNTFNAASAPSSAPLPGDSLEWQRKCSQNPAPLECFNPQGAALTQSITKVQQNISDNANDYKLYQIAVDNWKANDGRRWVNGVWLKTDEPPPPPLARPTDLPTVYAMFTDQIADSPAYDLTQQPYYVGGGITTTRGPNEVYLPQSNQAAAYIGTYDAQPAMQQASQATGSMPSYIQTTTTAAPATPDLGAIVTTWYLTYLGRMPEAGAVEWYRSLIAQGWTLSALEQNVKHSPEAQAYTASQQAPPPPAAPPPVVQQPAPPPVVQQPTPPPVVQQQAPPPAAPPPVVQQQAPPPAWWQTQTPVTPQTPPPGGIINYQDPAAVTNPNLPPTAAAPGLPVLTAPQLQQIGSKLQSPVGSLLPQGVADALPEAVTQMPTWVAGAAAAGALYYSLQGKTSRRKR